MKKLIAVVAILALFASSAFAQYVPEILKVKGDPKIMTKGSDSWVSCAVKGSVNDGDKIKTDSMSSLVIGFVEDRKNVVRIGQDTEAVIVSGHEPTYTIDLLKGDVTALLLSLPMSATFEITTPEGLGGAKGTGWRVLTNEGVSTFEAYDNTIYVKGLYADGSVTEDTTFVNMGYRTTVKKFSLPTPVERLTPADINRWNMWRDEVENIQARATEVKDKP